MPAHNRVPLSPLSFLQRARSVFPDKLAVVTSEGWSQTYAQFGQETDRLSARLQDLGHVGGSQVAILSRNGPELLRCHFAVPGAGAALVALNTRLAPPEYSYILADAQVSLLFVEPKLLDRIEPIMDGFDGEIVVLPDAATMEPTESDRWPNYSDWLNEHPAGDRGDIRCLEDEDNRIAINYTSGTTGKPKGAVYTHRGAYLNALGVALELQLAPTSTHLWTLPMFHCNGWCMTWAVTAVGGTHVTQADFDPEEALNLIDDHAVTHLCGAPVILESLAKAVEKFDSGFDQRVTFATGGAPPSPTSIGSLRGLGVEVVHLYGLTETYGPSLICEHQLGWDGLNDNEFALMLSRQGVQTVNVEAVRVLDTDHHDVPADGKAMGQIVVRSNTIADGYFGDAEATNRSFHEGWFFTGDLGVVHPDGYIEIRDRQKDIIISGGENISSIEVEHALLEHDAVREAAVVSRSDAKWGEVPVAFVALHANSSVTAEELVIHVQQRLARFKAPKAIVFEELPRTSTGKVMKFELRKRAADMRESSDTGAN